ncbi:MAG: hypothetical protein IJP74_01625 [Prevotella sp.]|nr:hypothetical protein [Prevotella sp.]
MIIVRKRIRRLFSGLLLLMMSTVGAMAQTESFATITTTADFTDGEAYYTTFSSPIPLNFSALASTVRAYAITKTETRRVEKILSFELVRYSLDAINVKALDIVPANTGILIKTKRPGTYRIPKASQVEVSVASDLVPVGDQDLDVGNVLNDFVDDERYYYIPYVLDVRDGELAFYADKSSFLGHGEGVEDVFAYNEKVLKKNTAYLKLDYWQDVAAYGGSSGSGVDAGNSTGKVAFEAKGDFDEQPDFTATYIDVPFDATDGSWFYSTYYNKDQDLDFSSLTDLRAFIVTADSIDYYPFGEETELGKTKVVNRINLQQVTKVPAATPLILRTATPDLFRVPLLDGNARVDDVSANVLEAFSEDTDIADMLNDENTPIYPYLLKSTTGHTGFGALLPDSVDGVFNKGEIIEYAGTVYLPLRPVDHNYVRASVERYLRFGVTVRPKEDDPDPQPISTVDITVSQRAASGDYYATFQAGEHALDFSDVDDLTAYKLTSEYTKYYPLAEKGDSSVVLDVLGRLDLRQVGIVPAQATFIVRASKAGTYSVPETDDESSLSMSGNILDTAESDINVEEMENRLTPLYTYTLDFTKERPGFSHYSSYDEAGDYRMLPKGSAYITVSDADHEYVEKSIQKYYPFGVNLKLPEIERPDTVHSDTIPEKPMTKIDIDGFVADATGNYLTFCSPDKTLDFSEVAGAKAYIVTAVEGQLEDGRKVVSRIDLKQVKRVAAATPIVVLADNPGEIEVPEVEESEALDSTEGNVLLVMKAGDTAADITYMLGVGGEGKAGFYVSNKELSAGDVYISLSPQAHEYAVSCLQKGLPFGEELQQPAPIGTTRITISGLVANTTGNYATFYSPDKTLDFTEVSDAKAFIVTAVQEMSDGQQVVTRIDLKEINRVPEATPIVVVAVNAGEIDIPEVDESVRLDPTNGNMLRIDNVRVTTRAGEEQEVLYFLGINEEGKVGFYASGMQADVCLPLSPAAHEYVMNSLQLGLPFGETLVSNGISQITCDNTAVSTVYSLSGQKTERLRKGVNIIRMNNGNKKKVMVK